MKIEEVRDHARAAVARGDFKGARAVLAAADAAGALTLADLPQLAEVSYAAGELDATFEIWERVHAARASAGDRMGAADAAVRVAQHLLLDTALMAPTRAWLLRAEALLDGHEDNPVFAWLAVVRNYEYLLRGDFAQAREWARRAIEIGTRCEPTAAAIAKVAEARGLVLDGHVGEGLRLLDEAAAAMLTQKLDPVSAGMIYCELVCGAQGVGQYELAEEWTTAMERWSRGGSVGSIHGRCRVHRAEILRLRGALADAEIEALGACEELRPYLRREMGWPLMIRLRRGDLAGAEEVFVAAHEVAWDPHPGLALVRLAQHDVPGALAAIRDALEHPLFVPSKERPPNSAASRLPLLEAKVEIDIAAGDHAGAAAAADELERLAARFESKAFTASAASARGRVLLAAGDLQAARRQLETAVGSWNEIGAPYETAVARSLLADAHDAAGQTDRARLERSAARATLERIGAVHRATTPASATSSPAAPSTPSAPPSSTPSVFRREGDTWLVEFDGHVARVRDLKGMRYLARLLAEPGRELHVLDVVAESATDVPPLGDAGSMLDARAKEMYRRRLEDITEDIETARSMNDLGRLAQAEREREFLSAELARAVGLGGRDRNASSASERARAAATRALRQALERVREHHPALAAHFDRTIKTGTYFAYLPDPRAPVAWVL